MSDGPGQHPPSPDDRILFAGFEELRNSPEVAEYFAAKEEEEALTALAKELNTQEIVWPSLSRPNVANQIMRLRFQFREAGRLKTQYHRNCLRMAKAYDAISEKLAKLLNEE